MITCFFLYSAAARVYMRCTDPYGADFSTTKMSMSEASGAMASNLREQVAVLYTCTISGYNGNHQFSSDTIDFRPGENLFFYSPGKIIFDSSLEQTGDEYLIVKDKDIEVEVKTPLKIRLSRASSKLDNLINRNGFTGAASLLDIKTMIKGLTMVSLSEL